MFSKMQRSICIEKSRWLGPTWPNITMYVLPCCFNLPICPSNKGWIVSAPETVPTALFLQFRFHWLSQPGFHFVFLILSTVIQFVCSPPILPCLSVLNTPTLMFYDFVITMEMREVWRRKWQCHLPSSKYVQYIILKTSWWVNFSI